MPPHVIIWFEFAALVLDGFNNRSFYSLGQEASIDVFLDRPTLCTLTAYGVSGQVVSQQMDVLIRPVFIPPPPPFWRARRTRRNG